MREARRLEGISQQELAEFAGMSRRPVYLLESGRGTIRVESLVRILDVLGLELVVRAKEPVW